MDSVKIVRESKPVEVQIGKVIISDPTKVQELFDEYFRRARAANQITYSEVARAISTKKCVRFNDGEDSILVKY